MLDAKNLQNFFSLVILTTKILFLLLIWSNIEYVGDDTNHHTTKYT